jgi:nicotinamide-nucleotide amidase
MPNPVCIQIADLLNATPDQRVVFAESCTGGLAAALVTQVPGASKWFCGSAVTYREKTKTQWLAVEPDTIQQFTAESRETTEAMANGALANTSEATIACAVTGHLGPDAPPEIDGQIFVAIAIRKDDAIEIASSTQHRLEASERSERQTEAADSLLTQLRDFLKCRRVAPRKS